MYVPVPVEIPVEIYIEKEVFRDEKEIVYVEKSGSNEVVQVMPV